MASAHARFFIASGLSVKPHRFLQVLDDLLKIAEFGEDHAQIVVGDGQIGIRPQGLAKVVGGLGESFSVGERLGPIHLGHGAAVRIKANNFAQMGLGLLVAVLLQ